MTIDSNSLTLAQYALYSNDPMVRAISYSLIDAGMVLEDIPITNAKTLKAQGVRFEGNLPTINWAKINEEGVVTSATPTPWSEQLYLIRNYIDVDKIFVEEQNAIKDPRAAQLDAFLKAKAYDFNDKFINNNHITGDVDAFIGIRERIDNGSTYGVKSGNKIDAGGVDLSITGTTADTANSFLEKLDTLLWSVGSPTGAGVVLYMNEVMQRRFAFAIRKMGTSGGFKTTEDQFGRIVDMYKNAIIRDVGYKTDQSTRIITTTETSAGADGSSNFTSIYAVNYSPGHFGAWQFEPMNPQDLGLLNNGVIYRTFIDWSIGVYNEHTRSLGRLYNIKLS